MSIETLLNAPDEFEQYSTQVAGHMMVESSQIYDLFTPEQLAANIGILRHKPTGHLLKAVQPTPRGEREIYFYEMCFLRRALPPDTTDVSVDSEHNDIEGVRINPDEPYVSLARLVPLFYGTRAVAVKDFAINFLELEDVTSSFVEPNILDVKIGWRTWDPNATAEKIQKSKDKYPLGQKLGFRFLGMNVFDQKTGQRHKRDKLWGRKVKETDIINVCAEYLCSQSLPLSYRHAVLTSLLDRLHDVLKVFSRQTHLVFYSTSILFVYEGRPPTTGALPERLTDLRMIDFTHVHRQRVDGQLDLNYLQGLKRLILNLSQLRDQLLTEQLKESSSSSGPARSTTTSTGVPRSGVPVSTKSTTAVPTSKPSGSPAKKAARLINALPLPPQTKPPG